MPQFVLVPFRTCLILAFLPLLSATAQEKSQIHLSSDVFIEKTAEKVYQEFRHAKIVVPGHGDPSGIEESIIS